MALLTQRLAASFGTANLPVNAELRSAGPVKKAKVTALRSAGPAKRARLRALRSAGRVKTARLMALW